MRFGGRPASGTAAVIVGLVLTLACAERKLVVSPNQDLLIRPPARDYLPGAPGFEIVAGWGKPYTKHFDYAAGQLSWTDGHDVFMGSDFAHGVGLGISKPPERWISDESGIYWTTHEHELWTASRQRGARVIWRFPGAAKSVALGRTAAYVVIAPAGVEVLLVPMKDHVEELWRVTKDKGEASRLWATRDGIGPVIVDGDVVFTPGARNEIRRIDGATGRHTVLPTGFDDIVGVDDRYIYGADGHAAYRAPRTGGRGEVLAQMDSQRVSAFITRFGSADAVFDRGQLFWMEGPGLQTASVQGGEQVLLAALSGSEVHVIPTGDAVYVHDYEMIYRVPRRPAPAPIEVPTGADAVYTFTSNGSTLFWVAELDIHKLDKNGTAPVVVAAGAEPASALAADETSVYFTSREGKLWRVPVSGGPPAQIAELESRDGPRVLTTAMDRTIALRGDEIIFASFARGAVARVKKRGGAPRILAEGIPGPRALLLDGDSIYLRSDDYKKDLACTAKLLRLPASGGKVTELASGLPCGGDIAMTGSSVWVGTAHEQLFRVPKEGGTAVPVEIHGGSTHGHATPADLAGFASSGDAVFVGAADRILRFDEGKPTPRVVASGLLYPASSLMITGRTLHFGDLHSSKGIPSGNLYALDLVGGAPAATDGPAARAASVADGPPARETYGTPWPARAPCPHPTALSLDEWLRSDLVWSSADGATALTFPPQEPKKPARLARTFPGDRLVRLTVAALAIPPNRSWLLRLDCPDQSTVAWGPCAGDRCGVTAEYRIARIPAASRTEHWTTPTRAPAPYDDWHDIHYSRFKQRIGWRKRGDAEIERQSLRLTRDIAADMRDCLAAACARGRCAEPIHVAERRLRSYLAARDARYTLFEHGKAYDHWNTGWTWGAAADGTTFKVHCDDMAESKQVFCSIELDVGDGLRVIYFPPNRAGSRTYQVAVADRPDWDSDHSIGKISFYDAPPGDHAFLVEISGRALGLEPAADVGVPPR